MLARSLGYRLARWLSARLPGPSAMRLAEQLADLRCRWSETDASAVQANLSLLLGSPVPREAPQVREVFRNFGRYLVEFFAMHQPQRFTVEFVGQEHVSGSQDKRARGVILLSAHLGNWELGAAALQRATGLPVSVVALPHGEPGVNRLFNQQRARCGVQVIPLGAEAARRSLERLRRGELVGLIGDRDFTGHGLRLSLCGQDVTLPTGPAILSLRSHAPIVPGFLVREGPWRFRFSFEPPIWPPHGEAEAPEVRAITEAYAAVIERYLKRFPEQWLMFRPLTARADPVSLRQAAGGPR